MEFTHLSLLALFCLIFVGTNGSKSGEEYWKSIWPNTPIPKPLLDLLLPDSKTSLPIRDHEENQYWTVFFEHDLYPGKKMSLGIHKHSKTQMSVENTNQPFGINTWWDKKSIEKANQAFETHMATNKAIDDEIRKPIETFGILIWTGKPNQDIGSRTKIDKATRENIEKTDQPFATRKWIDKKTKRLSQTSTIPLWTKEEMRIFHDYCGKPSPIGEDKYCAPSLELMMNYVISKLGKNIKAMSSSFAQSQDKYVVEEVKKIGDRAVMCHRLNLKKVAFYCHQVNATTTYMVPLVASDGTKSNALTICHHDTRGMDPSIIYEVLKVKPGTIPVCHFIGNKAIAWVPNKDVTEANGHPCVI
ncbi:embryonic abundant protein VF30.1-like [Vicia villosa]|uniref:embryonic abundant protein VF30.1-like n=1 Tax=Vicia villosa TaxID=3911 RepID=UPI00273C1631|nr:embryonic abundant protein VF30.1-like [Vicia villosa]